jgi:hypothetical protein
MSLQQLSWTKRLSIQHSLLAGKPYRFIFSKTDETA